MDPRFVLSGYWDDRNTPDNFWDDVWIDGDYHLKADSPCIDSGTSDNAPVTDMEGLYRYDVPAVINTGGGTYPFYDMGAYEYAGVVEGDLDGDEVAYFMDNCPEIYNSDQSDNDNDNVGNLCDNCPNNSNSSQTDLDNDTVGDACDNCTDTDNDGYGNPGFPTNTCPLDTCPNDQYNDIDDDGVCGDIDKCPSKPNGPDKGTCVRVTGGVVIGSTISCTGSAECGENEYCQKEQGDCNFNGIGDACECYADIDGSTSGKVDAFDLLKIKQEFNRTGCTPETCQADLNGDGKVDSFDLLIMKVQFGKIGCPVP